MGLKLSGGQTAKVGDIIIRQRGTKFGPGTGVKIGKDDTIYATKKGKVQFVTKRLIKYDGQRRLVKIVNVI